MTDHQAFRVYPSKSLTLVGRCYITDPCYFIKDDMWSNLCDEWFMDGKDDCSSGCIVGIGEAKILITRTAWGDGSYRVEGAGEFCVDSGTFAIAQVDQLEAAGLLVEDHCATYIEFDGLTKVSVDEKGRMFVGGEILVNTSEENWDEDDDAGDIEDWDGIEDDVD